MKIKKKLIFSLLTGFAVINNVYAKDFHVADTSYLIAALQEAATNGEDDVIYIKTGVYTVGNPIIYHPIASEHYSLTIKPEDPNGLVVLQRNVDAEVLKADFSDVVGKAGITLESIYIGDYVTQDYKKSGLLTIIGKDLNVKISNCNFNGSFSNVKNSNITLRLSNSTFESIGNLFFRTSSQNAGAISLEGNNNKILLEKNDFYSNKSIKGTVYLNTDNSDIIAINNRFNNNIVYYDDLNAKSGIVLEGNDNNVYLLDNYFFGNISNSDGGSIYISGQDDYASILHNTFMDNFSEFGLGSSIYLNIENSSYAEILNNNFAYNSAKSGGAIAVNVEKSLAFIGNNIFNQNHSFSEDSDNEFGGGVKLVSKESKIYFMNNTLYGNYTYGKGGGLSLYIDNDSKVNLINNIFWQNYSNNDNDNVGHDIYLDNERGIVNVFNNVYSFLAAKSDANVNLGGNLVNVDPQLKNPDAWDFHLEETSPCIDAGFLPKKLKAPSEFYKDIDDEPRVSGSAIDIGADEFLKEEEKESNNEETKRVGRLIIKKDNKISVNGLHSSKVKLICLRYYTIKEVEKYNWDINGDGQIDYETEIPVLEVNSGYFDPDNATCYVKYTDGSVEKVN